MKTHISLLTVIVILLTFGLMTSSTHAAQTTRMSVATAGTQANNNSFLPALNAQGDLVVFHSFATTLVPGDTNGVRDVFLRDRKAGLDG